MVVKIFEDDFGLTCQPNCDELEIVKKYTFINKHGMSAEIISYGAAIRAITIPDRYGELEDIALGFDNVDSYRSPRNPYIGATIGRVCNRIGKGTFALNEQIYRLSRNRGDNHLHGGILGFDKYNWLSHINSGQVVMTHVSDEGHEGYPGTLIVTLRYELTDENELKITYEAITSKPTPVNMTNHSYFNLAGHFSGYKGLYDHSIALFADSYTLTDDTLVPTGEIASVINTPYDLRNCENLGAALANLQKPGFDNNFCVAKTYLEGINKVARISHKKSGRVMEIFSDQPGVQFYTANFFPDPDNRIYPPGRHPDLIAPNGSEPLPGKEKSIYKKHAGFALETQKYPDSVNHANFPSVILNPGEVYKHEVIYRFSVQ